MRCESLWMRTRSACACTSAALAAASRASAFTTPLLVSPSVCASVARIDDTCESYALMVASAAFFWASSSAESISAIRSPAFTFDPSSTYSFSTRPMIFELTMTWLVSTMPISTVSLVRSVE